MNNQVKSLRLSEAIGLGRTLVTPNDGWRTLNDGKGCAVGMALAAVGETVGNVLKMKKHWPWTENTQMYSQISGRYLSVVRGDLTLDQLIDWVRSIEPAEKEAPARAEPACRSADREPRVLAAKP